MKVRCSQIYDAVQWDGSANHYVVKDTTWIAFGEQYVNYYVITGISKVSIQPGWWILFDNGHPHTVISPEMFNKHWEPV